MIEFIQAYNQSKEDNFKEQAILLQGQAQQIASAIEHLFSKKAKFLGLNKLYPEFFGKKKQIDTSNMSPEQIKMNHAFVWETFLGVK